MKIKQVLLLIACIVMLMPLHTSFAQEDENRKKIHVTITIDENGEKRSITRSYNSIEELKNDPEIENDQYNFLFDKEGRLLLELGDDDFGLFHNDENEEPFVFKFKKEDHESLHERMEEFNSRFFRFDLDESTIGWGGKSFDLKKDEEGNYYFEKDGERIDLDRLEEGNGFFHQFEEEGEEGTYQKRGFFFFDSEGDMENLDKIIERHHLKLDDLGTEWEDDSGIHEDLEIIMENEEDQPHKFKIRIEKLHKIELTDIGEDEVLLKDLGLQEESLTIENLAYYPNPSEGRFRLRFNTEAAPLEIKIMDLTGRTVYSETDNWFDGLYDREIDLSSRDPGIYFLQIVQNEKVKTKKLVIE